jgi:hypothetical protein
MLIFLQLIIICMISLRVELVKLYQINLIIGYGLWKSNTARASESKCQHELKFVDKLSLTAFYV